MWPRLGSSGLFCRGQLMPALTTPSSRFSGSRMASSGVQALKKAQKVAGGGLGAAEGEPVPQRHRHPPRGLPLSARLVPTSSRR